VSSGLILPIRGQWPKIADIAYIAPSAVVVGSVEMCPEANVWFNCTVRADDNTVFIGPRANIQDGTVIYTDGGGIPTHIGADVTIGHMALIHGCHLEDRAFVGMQAMVMDGAVVESDAMVTPGKRVPSGELWAGRPARKMRDLTPEEIAEYASYVPEYTELAEDYVTELAKPAG
jgi:carbonic anhydrase/acetyltransferase-like protein (isoleucine patch superfamily)